MRKRPLLLCACVFLAGLVYRCYNRVEPLVVLILWLAYEVACGLRGKRIKGMAGRSLLLLSAFILGSMRMDSVLEFRDAYLSKAKDGEVVTVWGEVLERKATAYGGCQLILTDCYVQVSQEVLPCNDVMVYASSNHFSVGEIHKISGKLHVFSGPRNDGAFDALTYYRSQRIDFYLNMDTDECLEQEGNIISKSLRTIRNQVAEVYLQHTSPRTAGFLSGMVLGDRSGLSEDLKELFTNGGIAHILAISGLHVSIIGKGLYEFLRKRRWSFATAGTVAGLLLLLYGNMVGNGLSAIRAIGMMLLLFGAKWSGKSYDMLNSLGGIGLYLLWQNPYRMEYSGFWFSVLALLGIGYVGEELAKHWGHGKGLLSSIGITLATLPVVACCYFELPLYAPLVNFLLLPLLTPIFLLALIGGFGGVVVPWLPGLVLWPCEWGLKIYEVVCGIIESLPFSVLLCGEPKVEVIVIYYSVLFLGIWRIRKCAHPKAMTVFLAVACFSLLLWPRGEGPRICFLDVGQGDGIYIATGDGTRYFIDGGSSDEKNLGKYTLLPFLKSNRINRIDYWFVSHADGDHISGLKEVLESGYEISTLLVSAEAPEDENLHSLLSVAKERGVTIQYMKAGDVIRTKHTQMKCLYPFTEMEQRYPRLAEDKNEMSLVLEYYSANVKPGGFYGLFCGDISTEVEKLLVKEGMLKDVDLFKANHHGSKYSNGEVFLQEIKPEFVVISCGAGNRYGHPAPEAIHRMEAVGTEIFYTMEGGQIDLLLVQ